MLKVLKRHFDENKKVAWSETELSSEKIENIWERALKLGGRYGFRNSQATAIAPTGTIGLVMDSETTGIEPEYALMRTKNLSGGGVLRLLSPSLEHSLQKLGYDGAARFASTTVIESRRNTPWRTG